MTGEKELPEGERSVTGGREEGDRPSGLLGPAGAKNPTWRTFGSITVRAARRWSIGDSVSGAVGVSLGF